VRETARSTIELSVEVQRGGDQHQVGEGLGEIADLV